MNFQGICPVDKICSTRHYPPEISRNIARQLDANIWKIYFSNGLSRPTETTTFENIIFLFRAGAQKLYPTRLRSNGNDRHVSRVAREPENFTPVIFLSSFFPLSFSFSFFFFFLVDILFFCPLENTRLFSPEGSLQIRSVLRRLARSRTINPFAAFQTFLNALANADISGKCIVRDVGVSEFVETGEEEREGVSLILNRE